MTSRAPRRRSAVRLPPEQRDTVAYLRVSTEEQARDGYGLPAQEARLRAHCEAYGLTLGRIYRDEGVSAGKPLASRPAGGELLADVRRGKVAAVLAIKLDRLFRDAVDCMQRATEWEALGVGLVLLDMGGQAVDTRSAAGRFMLNVLAAAAEMERNRIRERTRDALTVKRQRGERLGTSPLGFVTPPGGSKGNRLVMVPDAGELVAVRLILARRSQPSPPSFREIAAELTASEIPTKRGKTWHPETVRKVWGARERYAAALAAAVDIGAPETGPPEAASDWGSAA